MSAADGAFGGGSRRSVGRRATEDKRTAAGALTELTPETAHRAATVVEAVNRALGNYQEMPLSARQLRRFAARMEAKRSSSAAVGGALGQLEQRGAS